MRTTKVDGLVMLDFRVAEPEDDGFCGLGLLLRDPAADHHGVFFWAPEPERLLIALTAGIEYEIRDESLDIPVLTEKGLERLEQTREFIRPRVGSYPFRPVVKRVEFGKQEPAAFRSYAIPARTSP